MMMMMMIRRNINGIRKLDTVPVFSDQRGASAVAPQDSPFVNEHLEIGNQDEASIIMIQLLMTQNFQSIAEENNATKNDFFKIDYSIAILQSNFYLQTNLCTPQIILNLHLILLLLLLVIHFVLITRPGGQQNHFHVIPKNTSLFTYFEFFAYFF